MPRCLQFAIICCFSLFIQVGATRAAEKQLIRQSIEKAVPYIIKEGNSWIESKDCTSCHRTSFMTWSLAAAADVGVEVDGAELEELRVWSRADLNKLNEEDQKPAATRNLECVSHILWAERQLFTPRKDHSTRATFLKYVIEGQQEGGLWKANGQLPLQRRDKNETALVSSMWHALALGTSPDTAAQDARKKAMVPITKAAPGTSTEALMLRILLADQSQDKKQTAHWVSELKSRQRDDGSWDWVGETGSDPMATGMAVYAFSSVGLPDNDSAILKAVDFLLVHQADNGSWETTPGTKKKAQGKPVETSIYWGTCWSVIGLTAVLEEK